MEDKVIISLDRYEEMKQHIKSLKRLFKDISVHGEITKEHKWEGFDPIVTLTIGETYIKDMLKKYFRCSQVVIIREEDQEYMRLEGDE